MKNNIVYKFLFLLVGGVLGFASFLLTKSISLSVLGGMFPSLGSDDNYYILELVVIALLAIILYIVIHKNVKLTISANAYRLLYLVGYSISTVLMFIRWGVY